MAEFKEVMQQYFRMCRAIKGCEDCPLKEFDFSCRPGDLSDDEEDLDIWETTVMEWARNHPEPVYISARELCKFIYSQVSDIDAPLPESIAKKFNLIPINECGLTKYEKGEWAP